MFMTRFVKVAPAGLILVAMASGVEGLAQDGSAGLEAPPRETPRAARANDTPTREVKPGKVRFEVIERGELGPARAQVFQSEVEGRATIIALRPDGSEVKEGELICELDSSPFKEKLINQTITTRAAEAAYQQARLAREVAEIALRQYVEGTLEAERLTLKTTIASAESAVRAATVRLERIRDVRKRVKEALAGKGEAATPADMVAELDVEDRLGSAERALERERRALERAKVRRDVLEKSTSKKRSAELKGEVEHRRSDELTRLVAWRAEKSKEGSLRRQIDRCKIGAPFRGYIVLAGGVPQMTIGGDPKIEVGSSVRQREYLFKLLDLDSPLRVNTRVHESGVELVRPGQHARIILDAFPQQTMTGVVQSVAALPDASSFFEPKVYSTSVEIDRPIPNLRPGMAAQVEVLVPELENVLSVPFKAVLYFDDKTHLAVKKPDGGFEWREVAVAHSDGTIAVIGRGLKSGDVVALDPFALWSEAEKRRKFGRSSDEE
jgi:HlyD family secretion protein